MKPVDLAAIRAITFDVGGTLIDPWPSVGHVYATAAREILRIEAAPEILNRQFAEAWRSRRGFDYSREAWLDLVCRTFDGICLIPQAFFDQLYKRFGRPDAWRIQDDVLPTLLALRSRNLRLGIISNWDERLRALLSDLGLSEFFEVIVISVEAGATKPAPEIFRHTLDKLGLPAADVLHVGDSRTEDFLGAKDAGIRPLLLDRDSPAADHATSIHRLTDILDGLVG